MSVHTEDLYRRYGPMVHRRCRALLRDDEEATEAMQDVFVEVLRRAERLEIGAPSSFLYRTATNVCLNRIRAAGRRPQDADTDLVERIACAPVAEERTAVRQLLDTIFARERPDTRDMAVLHLVDGMTLEQVAAQFGMSVSGVRKRLRVLKTHVAEMELS